MPHSLPAILEHIRQQNRPNSHDAVLVREIERLTREVASLRGAECPIRYARPAGETFAEMRTAAGKGALYQHGDCILIWVNEGDLFSLSRPMPIDLTETTDV